MIPKDKKNRSSVRLYNVLSPAWLLYFMPTADGAVFWPEIFSSTVCF